MVLNADSAPPKRGKLNEDQNIKAKPTTPRRVLQDPAELRVFIELIKREKAGSYLEIGSKFGGSFWAIVQALPRGARAVAVDEGRDRGDLETIIRDLRDRGYDARCIIGDSTNEKVVERVRSLGPYDMCLIDANHTEPFVRKDWENYGPMARMVAFHDIAYGREEPDPTKLPIDVPKVWAELKADYVHEEIKLCATGEDNGIGILWR
jgi:hypothetical protein